jgi:hypothetical protein
MKSYSDEAVKHRIKEILAGKHTTHPNDPNVVSIEDSLFNLIVTIETTAYGAGMREVQQGVIKALDLRHLLGV